MNDTPHGVLFLQKPVNDVLSVLAKIGEDE